MKVLSLISVIPSNFCYCELYTYFCICCWHKFILSPSFIYPFTETFNCSNDLYYFVNGGWFLYFCGLGSLHNWVSVWLETMRPEYCVKDRRSTFNCITSSLWSHTGHCPYLSKIPYRVAIQRNFYFTTTPTVHSTPSGIHLWKLQ